MNPSSTPPPDYLDQISASSVKKPAFGLNLRTVILLGAALIVVVLLGVAAINIFSSNNEEPWARLSARLAATQKVATDSSNKIKNSQLRSTNSDLKLVLSNTIRDIETPLTSLGINPAKLPADISKQEDSATMLERLENARLNAKFDSTYARELNYQLSNLLTLLQQVYNLSRSSETKTKLENAYNSLLPIQQKVANFSASNE